MKAFVKAISYYLPVSVLTNEELVKEFPEWTVEKVAGKVGISERRIAGVNETSADLAFKAGTKLFTEHNINPEGVDFLLFCTQSPDYLLPTTACTLQDRLKIPIHAGALDFNLGCSGFVYGLALAKGLILGRMAKNVLLITSETYSKFMHPKDKTNRTIFGDAAAATLISTSGFAEIGEFNFGTDGSGAENLIVKTGGMRNPDLMKDLEFDTSGNPRSSDHLFMNGTEIFNFTLEKVPEMVDLTLEENKTNKEEIDLFVFHQANKYMLNFLRKKIRIPEEKFYYFIENVGNTVSATIPIALYEAQRDKSIRPGHKVLIAGFGVGYSWAGNMLTFN